LTKIFANLSNTEFCEQTSGGSRVLLQADRNTL